MNEKKDSAIAQDQTPHKPRGCLWWGGRLLLGLLVLLVVINLAGLVYQRVAERRDQELYPPPGEIVDVRGSRMHLYCMGEGTPTVILESGANSSALDWALVQPEVATFTRVCAYDRPGFGWSEPVSGSPTVIDAASTLHSLLEAAQVSGPYVLVGHSLGGVYVRAFASKYPTETVGIVLVDPGHEDVPERVPAEFIQFQKSQMMMYKFCRYAAPFGCMRVIKLWISIYEDTGHPEEDRNAILSNVHRSSFCKAANNEMEASFEISSIDVALPHSLADLPLIVLIAGTEMETQYDELPPAISSIIDRDIFLQSYAIIEDLKRELVSISSQGKLVVANQSGHFIHLDQPELVVQSIREVFKAGDGGS